MIYPRRTGNADGTQTTDGMPLTGYSGPQRVTDAGTSPSRRGPRDPNGNVDADYSVSGYDRMYRAPSKAETPGNMLTPIMNPAPDLPGQAPSSVPPADPSHFSWSGSAYAGGGQSGSPTQFGNNFIGMQSYLNANKTPGLTNQSFDQYAAGPNAGYSKNMNALDSAMYGFYGVKDTRPKPADGTAAAAAPDATPSAGATTAPVQNQNAAAAVDARDTNFDAMKKGLGGRQQRS